MGYVSPEQFIDDICIRNHILQRVCVEVTYRCNERCRHCYIFDEEKSMDDELSVEQYIQLFTDLKKLGTLHITFTGGDPSQRTDFTEILRGAVESDFAVSIFTNGIGYSNETLAEIINIRPASISFSVYSGIPEEHDNITGIKGSFQKTLATIKKVKDAGIMITIKTPVMTPTLKGLPAIQTLCKEFDVYWEVSYFICATNHGNVSPTKLRLGDVEKYKQIMKLVQKQKKEQYEFKIRDVHSVICGTGQFALSINPYGEVFPCNGFSYRLGNIKETSIEEIWNGDALKGLYELRFDQLGDTCLNCQYRNDCLYCLGSSLAENGNVFLPVKESCRIAQATYEIRLKNQFQ